MLFLRCPFYSPFFLQKVEPLSSGFFVDVEGVTYQSPSNRAPDAPSFDVGSTSESAAATSPAALVPQKPVQPVEAPGRGSGGVEATPSAPKATPVAAKTIKPVEVSGQGSKGAEDSNQDGGESETSVLAMLSSQLTASSSSSDASVTTKAVEDHADVQVADQTVVCHGTESNTAEVNLDEKSQSEVFSLFHCSGYNCL